MGRVQRRQPKETIVVTRPSNLVTKKGWDKKYIILKYVTNQM